jgi:hypothetical protein
MVTEMLPTGRSPKTDKDLMEPVYPFEYGGICFVPKYHSLIQQSIYDNTTERRSESRRLARKGLSSLQIQSKAWWSRLCEAAASSIAVLRTMRVKLAVPPYVPSGCVGASDDRIELVDVTSILLNGGIETFASLLRPE